MWFLGVGFVDMGKRPAFQFYTGDWLKDPALSLCRPATRGVWIDALCRMHDSDRSGHLEGTVQQLARACRCDVSDMQAAIDDLRATGAATVTERNSVVTLTNRRMQAEHEKRLATRERVGRHRRNTVVASSSSSSTSIEPSGSPLPHQLDDPEFREAWQRWHDHRAEIRHPLTPTTERLQLKKLAAWGSERAVAALEHSISNGWQGIFEPEQARGGGLDPAQAAMIDRLFTESGK